MLFEAEEGIKRQKCQKNPRKIEFLAEKLSNFGNFDRQIIQRTCTFIRYLICYAFDFHFSENLPKLSAFFRP